MGTAITFNCLIAFFPQKFQPGNKFLPGYDHHYNFWSSTVKKGVPIKPGIDSLSRFFTAFTDMYKIILMENSGSTQSPDRAI